MRDWRSDRSGLTTADTSARWTCASVYATGLDFSPPSRRGILGVIKSHSRPHVSNDNPYSAAQFKTMKYCPQFPDRFGSIQDSRCFCGGFFDYYNTEHRHSGIGLMAPAVVHYGLAEQLLAARQETLLAAYREHPERFVRRPPQPPVLPQEAWINPPPQKSRHENGSGAPIVTPGHPVGTPDFERRSRPGGIIMPCGGNDLWGRFDTGGCTLNANATCLKAVDTFRFPTSSFSLPKSPNRVLL